MLGRRHLLFGLAVTSAALASVVLVRAASVPTIPWWAIGGGGGSAVSGSVALDSTTGQAVVGVATSAASRCWSWGLLPSRKARSRPARC